MNLNLPPPSSSVVVGGGREKRSKKTSEKSNDEADSSVEDNTANRYVIKLGNEMYGHYFCSGCMFMCLSGRGKKLKFDQTLLTCYLSRNVFSVKMSSQSKCHLGFYYSFIFNKIQCNHTWAQGGVKGTCPLPLDTKFYPPLREFLCPPFEKKFGNVLEILGIFDENGEIFEKFVNKNAIKFFTPLPERFKFYPPPPLSEKFNPSP